MDIKKRQALAKKVFNAIKDKIVEGKKWNKEHPNAPAWEKRAPVAELAVCMKYGYATEKKDCYRIKAGGYWDAPVLADDIETLYDLKEVISEVDKLISEQKKVKGWGTLNVAYDTATFDYNTWNPREVKYPAKITLCEKPCKEFTALQNFINKYGKAARNGKLTYGTLKLNNFELFCSAMGGKRGRLWDEYGDRRYLDNKPNKCTEILAELRKVRGAKDIMLCERGEENYIDPIDQKYSAYHEVECEGEKRSYIIITIKTPQGKVKYENKIY